jgi:Leucine Rich repeat
MATKKPAAKKPAAKKAPEKKPLLDLDDPNVVPKLMEMAHAQAVEREKRAAKEARKPAKPVRGEVAIRPANPPHWGYSFEVHPSVPEAERVSLHAFFERFTTLGDSYAILIVCAETPAEDRRAAWDGNRIVLELEQLRAHMPEADVAARTERLRRALARSDYEKWFEVVMLLSTWDDATLPAAIAMAEEGLARWPDVTRYEVKAWRARPELLRLTRVAWGTLADALQRPGLDAVTVLQTQDPEGLTANAREVSQITHLAISGHSGLGAVVAGCVPLTKLTSLELQQPTYTHGTKPIDLKKLLKAPHLGNLTSLSLYGYTLSPPSLDALAKCAQPLARLRIEYGKMKPAAADPLARLASRRRLTSLLLKYNDLGPEGAAALFARPDDWSALRVLDISANEIGDDGTLALTRAALTELRWLCLSSNAPQQQLTERAAVALANAPSLAKLESLFLMGHPVGTKGVAALLHAPALRSLKRLNVSFSECSLAELFRACGEAEPVALTELSIGNNDASKKADWTRATFLRSVKSLSLDSLDGCNYEGLFACPHLGSLEVLVLGGCYTNADAAFEALVSAPALPSLRYLGMQGWKPTAAQARAMAKSPLFKSLWGVQMMSSYVPPEAWRAFYDAGLPLVHSVFDQFPANEVSTYTTFRDEV